MNITFRTEPVKSDIQRVIEIVESTKFFYDHEIEVAAELVTERLSHGESTGYYFVFAEVDGVTVAYSCYGPITMSKTSFDLYWIATHNDYRGKGIGKKLLEETCRHAKKKWAVQLLLPRHQVWNIIHPPELSTLTTTLNQRPG